MKVSMKETCLIWQIRDATVGSNVLQKLNNRMFMRMDKTNCNGKIAQFNWKRQHTLHEFRLLSQFDDVDNGGSMDKMYVDICSRMLTNIAERKKKQWFFGSGYFQWFSSQVFLVLMILRVTLGVTILFMAYQLKTVASGNRT